MGLKKMPGKLVDLPAGEAGKKLPPWLDKDKGKDTDKASDKTKKAMVKKAAKKTAPKKK